MQKKHIRKGDKSRKEDTVANAITVDSEKKMLLKENRISRPQQRQNRKWRLVPPKTSIVDGMREAAQLASNYMYEIGTHHQGSHHPGRFIQDLGQPLSYERLLDASLNLPQSEDWGSLNLPQKVSLMSHLHTNGVVPKHLLDVDPGLSMINKRSFLADAAEESRVKRLRKLGNLTALEETLGYQGSMPPSAYGSNHDNSPLLPTPPCRPLGSFDFSKKDLDLQYFHKSQTAPYSDSPPSPTPHTRGAMNAEMRLDSSAFPSMLKLDATSDGFYDAMNNHQIKRPVYLPLSQHHLSAKDYAGNPHNSVLTFPGDNNLTLSPLDGFLHSQNGTLTHMIPCLANGDQKSQMLISDAAYLGQIGQEVPIGLPQLNRQHVAAYLGHLAALQNLPEHDENSMNGQHEGTINRLNSLHSNSSAGILPLPRRLKFEGNKNNRNDNLISYGCFSPDAGILPLPNISELSQMASFQHGIPAVAQGLNGTPGQSFQFPLLPAQGDIMSLQEEPPCQRSVAGNRLQRSLLQNHFQLMNKELSAERDMERHYHLLSAVAYQNDLASSQQSPLLATASGQHFIMLQDELGALQQEVSSQRLLDSFLLPTRPSNDLASLQYEHLSQRLNAGNHPLLQSLAQQNLTNHALRGGYHPRLQTLHAQYDLDALQQEVDFRRLNFTARPLVQSALQQYLAGPNFHCSPGALFPTVHM
ncbi:hypothetical protein R1sor_026043 [Riccia sorocarpa]|uniref:Uncharacterized protein n=1 Tax=Riccia sorocarpa TaxID=122646 RepID=A0ABD3GAC3_9MARC